MASIVFGAGTSHTPMLNMTAEEWPLFEEVDRHRPHQYPDGRAATYDELLVKAPASLRLEITPDKHASRHGEAMAALGRLRDGLGEARLDALIVVGDDHKELYHDDNMPAVLVYRGETIANVPNRTGRSSAGSHVDGARRPSWMQRAAARYYEENETRHYPVHAGLANFLIGALVEAEFDVSSANALPSGEGEGHAFGFVHRTLMTAAIPVVPIVLNTYYPPNQPSPRRCYRLGQAIREAVERYPGDLRVGIVASGGLSHFTIDEQLDREVVRALKEKDGAALQDLPRARLNSGNSEIRNWICVGGAMEHLGMRWVTYCPGYRTPAGTGTGLCFAHWA
jgi:3-O-methylgallate 3,4-dioxygenase